jgi:hypothetical protein
MGVSAPAQIEGPGVKSADVRRVALGRCGGPSTPGFIATPDSHIPPSPLPMRLPNGTLFLAQSACKAPLKSSGPPTAPDLAASDRGIAFRGERPSG